MKTEKNILIAFILNLAFSIFEFFGGIFTGSVAIISDAVHDIGDAASIGIAFILEKKSKKAPDKKYTYGYVGYSVIGGLISTSILLFGSIAVIYNAIDRIISPVEINYNGMIIFAVIGVCINLTAAFLTQGGKSLNQKAVNLHMLEDVLGWVVVLVGAIVMRFTSFYIIDPLMSIGVAIFIIIGAIKNLKEIFDIILQKTPCDIDIDELTEEILTIEGVLDVHHIHVRSIDGTHNCATMHVVTGKDPHGIKNEIREKLKDHGIHHITLELESENEHCENDHCHINASHSWGHHHHHHHH